MPLLSQAEYESTFSPPMLDVTMTAEEIVDLWAYASDIVDSEYPDAGSWDWRVMFIYESRDGRFQHLNIPVPVRNTYLSIVVDKPNRRILGHYLLDLEAAHPEWKSPAIEVSGGTTAEHHSVQPGTSCPTCEISTGSPSDA